MLCRLLMKYNTIFLSLHCIIYNYLSLFITTVKQNIYMLFCAVINQNIPCLVFILEVLIRIIASIQSVTGIKGFKYKASDAYLYTVVRFQGAKPPDLSWMGLFLILEGQIFLIL